MSHVTLTLIIVLLDFGADRALEGLVDGLGLEVLSATGAQATLGIHGSLERVTLPYAVVSRAVWVGRYLREPSMGILPGARGQTHSRKRSQHAGPTQARPLC